MGIIKETKTEKIKVLLCTNSPDKENEIRKIIRDNGSKIQLLSFKDLWINIDIVEDDDTLVGNAKLKIKALLKDDFKNILNDNKIKYLLSDDSGIFVEAMDGNPGVFSARFLGEGATAKEKNEAIINTLIKFDDRGAAMMTSGVCYNLDTSEYLISIGTQYGSIATEERGSNGFDYDTIFIPEESEGVLGDKTYAEMTQREKLMFSSRTMAFEPLIKRIGE